MHVLSARNRSEFLATPQLIRFEYGRGAHGFEPTLLIKGSTLLLKYIALGVPMQLAFAKVADRLLYAWTVFDDPDEPGVLWSSLEQQQEREALAALLRGESCQTFLFNELAVNVAGSALSFPLPSQLADMLDATVTGRAEYPVLKAQASDLLERLHQNGASDPDWLVVEIPGTTRWNSVHNTLITSHADSSPIDLFSRDEGTEQERLAVWLTDSLNPGGVHHQPQIPKGKGSRELSDLLLSYEFGSFLIESKSLAILDRDRLPNRIKLSRDISKHVSKAASQLRGGIRQLKAGTPITALSGAPLDVERTQPVHGIILIPDLDLVQDHDAYGLPFIEDFMRATGGFIHLLDVSELLRIVQAAEMIAKRGQRTTPMMAFDYYLMERAKKTLDAGTLCIEVLLRFAD
jgi:hypothetical protein